MELYTAVVTTVPFLLLTLVAERSIIFGPVPGEKHSRFPAVVDGLFLFSLAVAFFASLVGLSVQEPPDLRLYAGFGLGLGAFGVFGHAAVAVASLYRKPQLGTRDGSDRPGDSAGSDSVLVSDRREA